MVGGHAQGGGMDGFGSALDEEYVACERLAEGCIVLSFASWTLLLMLR